MWSPPNPPAKRGDYIKTTIGPIKEARDQYWDSLRTDDYEDDDDTENKT